MEKLIEIISSAIASQNFSKITLSNPSKKSSFYKKIIAEPIQQGKLYYQISKFYETKVKHENVHSKAELVAKLLEQAEGFRQIDITADARIKVLRSKNNNMTVIRQSNDSASTEPNKIAAPHNRQKNYILQEGIPIPWLCSLGIMNKDGKVLSSYQKKFRQLNKFLEMVQYVLQHIPNGAKIVDFGCGKSYLTFALYYFLNELHGKNVTITGLDLKADVVEGCTSLAKSFGFDGLNFICQNISDYEAAESINMVITLHACDTATDYALYNAIKWNCQLIMSVPCCQHELFSQIKNQSFNALLKHGILKERFSALYTDALRAALLEAYGYKTNVIEFIDMEHTAKNIMIRAVKRQKQLSIAEQNSALNNFMDFKDMFGATPKLYELLQTIDFHTKPV